MRLADNLQRLHVGSLRPKALVKYELTITHGPPARIVIAKGEDGDAFFTWEAQASGTANADTIRIALIRTVLLDLARSLRHYDLTVGSVQAFSRRVSQFRAAELLKVDLRQAFAPPKGWLARLLKRASKPDRTALAELHIVDKVVVETAPDLSKL